MFVEGGLRSLPALPMKRWLPLALVLLPLLAAPGCGTLFFSERQHEPHSDKLDPNILILDGIGLVFFVVPGLVAFGIDFYTGAIYLPEGVERGEGPFLHDRD